MFEKINTSKINRSLNRLNDVRTLGMLAFGVIVLLVSWSGVKAVQTNYDLQRQIASLQQENQVHELENQNQKLKNQYLETDAFLELAARRQFGLGVPGEKEVLIPRAVALAHTHDLPSPPAPSVKQLTSKPGYQRNFQAWVDFFMHRQTAK